MLIKVQGESFIVSQIEGFDGISQLYYFNVEIITDTCVSYEGMAEITDEKDIHIWGEIEGIHTICNGKRFVHQIKIVSPLAKLAYLSKNQVLEKISAYESLNQLELVLVDKSDQIKTELDYVVQYQQTNLEFFGAQMIRAGLMFTYDYSTEGVKIVLFNKAEQLSCAFDEVLLYDYAKTSEFMIRDCRFVVDYNKQKFYTKMYDFTKADQEIVVGAVTDNSLSIDQFNKVCSQSIVNNFEQHKTETIEIVTSYFIKPGTSITVSIFGKKQKYTVISVKYHLTNTILYSYVTATKTLYYIKPVIAKFPHAHMQLGKVVEGLDEWSRVKVQFLWGTEKDCMFMRVCQRGTGSSGMFHLPRIGDEVLIDFYQSDIEQPIIIGSLLNSINIPDHNVEEKDISYWKMSQTDKPEKVSKIMLDANPDKSLVNVEACQDMNVIVENNLTTTVKEGDMSTTITKGNVAMTLTEGDVMYELTKGSSLMTLTEGDMTVKLDKGALNHIITGDVKYESEGFVQKISKTCDVTVDKDCKLTVSNGGYTISVSSGAIEIKANSLTQKANDITVKASGNLTLEGANVKIKGSASVKIEGAMLECKGSATTKISGGASVSVEGGAMAQIKGGIVKIN